MLTIRKHNTHWIIETEDNVIVSRHFNPSGALLTQDELVISQLCQECLDLQTKGKSFSQELETAVTSRIGSILVEYEKLIATVGIEYSNANSGGAWGPWHTWVFSSGIQPGDENGGYRKWRVNAGFHPRMPSL